MLKLKLNTAKRISELEFFPQIHVTNGILTNVNSVAWKIPKEMDHLRSQTHWQLLSEWRPLTSLNLEILQDILFRAHSAGSLSSWSKAPG